MKTLSSLLAIALLVAGCAGIYSTIITITQVRKDVMNEYGKLYRAGKISTELDTKIVKADENYRLAANQCERVLIAYKTGAANKADVAAQIANVKIMLAVILDVLEPYLVEQKSAQLNQQLATATQL